MKKFFATILSLLLFVAFGVCSWTVTPKQVGAQEEIKNHAVVTDDYAAISSGKKIYLFSKTVGFWQEYEHAYAVGKLQIDGAGILYFLDSQDELQTLDIVNFYQTSTPQSTGIFCMDFVLWGENLLFAKGQTSSTDCTQFFQTPIGDFTNPTFACELDDNLRGLIFGNATVYALGGGGRLYKHVNDFTQIATLSGAKEIAVAADKLFCLTESSLQSYALADLTSPIDEKTGNFSALTTNGTSGYAVKEGKPYVYDPIAKTVSQALGIFSLPSVHAIQTGTIKTDIAGGNTSFSVASTTQSALLIEVDLQNATEYLPYLGSIRGEPILALKVWQNANHALLYYQNPTSGEYQTFLVNVEETQEQPTNTVVYQTPKIAYTTNAVGRYAYPLLALSPLDSLTKGEQIQIVGEINGLGVEYYAIQKGETTGYIPKAYAAPSLNEASLTQTEVVGEGKDEDGVWRLIYLLLGVAAIGILIDFIILRNKQEE